MPKVLICAVLAIFCSITPPFASKCGATEGPAFQKTTPPHSSNGMHRIHQKFLTNRKINSIAPIQTDITVSFDNPTRISPLIYGINYDWNLVSLKHFDEVQKMLERASKYTLMRIPGGTNAEYYDVEHNVELIYNADTKKVQPGCYAKKDTVCKGAGPQEILQANTNSTSATGYPPITTYITKTYDFMTNPSYENFLSDNISVESKLTRYGLHNRKGVKIWEIGNEWYFHKFYYPTDPIDDFKNYVKIAASEITKLKMKDPSNQVYINTDWNYLDHDLYGLNAIKTALSNIKFSDNTTVWDEVDGIAIHPYCGEKGVLCSSLPRAVSKIIGIAGPNKLGEQRRIYASEWNANRAANEFDKGMQGATNVIKTLRYIAQAGIYAAAYWPAANFHPVLSLINSDATQPMLKGLAFGLMAQYYEGEALQTTTSSPIGTEMRPIALAARRVGKDGSKCIELFVLSNNASQDTIRVQLGNLGARKVLKSEVLWSNVTEDDGKTQEAEGEIADLGIIVSKATAGKRPQYIQFTLNPGTPGRGNFYEIAHITLLSRQ